MGLFEKKYCSLCGGKAGSFLDRERLAGEAQYLCEDCQSRCSRDLLREGISELTVDQIREHIAYLEKCERIYNDVFEDTTCFTAEEDEDDELILVDENRGWWVDCNSDDYMIFTLDSIGKVKVGVDTTSASEEEFSNIPSPGDMDDIEDELGDDMPIILPSERIERVYVEVQLKNHPWIKTTRIYLLDDEEADPDDVEEALLDAGGLANYLREIAGGESVPVEEEA